MAKSKLSEYSAKRKFEATPEPGPVPVEGRRGPLIFVIQTFSAPRLHYDLRLECDGVLMSWAVPKGPSLDPAEKRLAVRTENHPFDYGSFEGVIPPGQYGAGEVIVWDCGVYSPDEDQEYWFHDREEAERRVREGMEKGKLGILLRGEKVKGSFALVRTKDAKNWLLIKHKDRFAAKVDLTAQNRSVLSGVTVEQLTSVPVQRLPAALLTASGDKRPFPDKLLPMHAELGDKVFNSADWMWEPKLDGYRALALIDGHGVKLRSRRGLELGGDFPRLADELGKQLIESMVLDGEIVAFDASGKPSFGAMQNRAEFVMGGYTKGKGARAPLGALLLGYWQGNKLRYASHVGSGLDDRSIKRTKALLEPLQRKTNPFAEEPELNAPTSWVEPKLVAEVKFQGWTDDHHLRAPVFLRLRDDIDAKEVRHKVEKEKASQSLSEVEQILDQLKTAKAALTLAVGAHQVRLTHLDRVYWPADPALKQPALTKRDLLRYFAQVSPFILPHLADRPLTMIRMPDGIGGQRFFQKHWEQERPDFVETITVFSSHKDEQHAYLLCNNLPTLLWLAQSGTLEFHVWHSRAKPGPDTAGKGTDYASSLAALESSVLNYPDYVVFDIDPYIYSGKRSEEHTSELQSLAFEKGKEVAFRLRELLNSMALEPIVKTSGKTGLHVFLPIRRTIDFDAARQVSEFVGRHLMRLHPKDITLEWSVPKRTGKIFMDYNMNVRGKTLNVAYSPRGAPGAPVSMPVTWEELANAHPLDFRLANAAERLARTGDRWGDVLKRKQSLEKVLERSKA